MSREAHAQGRAICVVGGGIAGTVGALRLAADGHRVRLLAGSAALPPAGDDEIRYYALSPASTAMLARLGVDIQALGACPYTDMRVWGGALRDGLHFSMADAPFDAAALGHIVGHGALLRALRARADSALKVMAVDALATETLPERVDIDCSDGDLVTAELVMAADGAHSALREAAGIPVNAWQYEQRGIVANIECDAGLQATAWQRFLPDGVLALLPLDAERASIVWSADDATADHLMGLDDGAFGEVLAAALQQHLGGVRVLSRRAGFPLGAAHAERYWAPRLALLGDSAHVVHPLAGQGLNLGLADAGALAGALARHPGELERALRAYSRRRRAATADMIMITDGLHRLLGPAGPDFAELREAGMAMVNRLTPLRRMLVERALDTRDAQVS